MHERLVARSVKVRLSLCLGACLAVSTVRPAEAAGLGTAGFAYASSSPRGSLCADWNWRSLPLALSAADLSSFEPAMRKISAAAGVAIVAEGVPMHSELSDAEAADLVKAVSSVPGDSAAATLAVVARAFDYDVERAASGIFLLRKHHSDPKDLPDVTYDEVVRSLDSLFKLLDVYARTPPVTSVDPSTFRLYGSLTPEQQARAQSVGGLTLTLADLDPAQKDLALEAAQNTVLDGRTRAVRQVLKHLIALHDKNVNFLWTTRTDQGVALARKTRNGGSPLHASPAIRDDDPVFEYVIPSGRSDHIYQFPLNHGLRINLSGGGFQLSISELEQVAPDLSGRRPAHASGQSTSINGAIPAIQTGKSNELQAIHRADWSDYDPTAPTPEDRRLASGMMSNKLASTVSLEELAKSLSSVKSHAGAAGSLKVTIDPALNGKPVTIFGGDPIPGNQLIRLASRVYGLQISTADNKAIFITTPKVRPFNSVSDLQSEIKRVIPPSLLRATESQIDRIAALTPDTPGLPDERPLEERQKWAAMLAEQKRFMAARNAALSWYFPADRRLLVLATAAVPTLGSPPVSVASLGAEPSRLIALMSLNDGGMVAIRKLLSFVPPLCLTDPSTMRIVLTFHEGGAMQSMGIRFASVDSAGLVTHEGMSSFGRPKPK